MLTKHPWEGQTMRNTGPSRGLGPLQALNKEIIMSVIGWQSKPTKPSKAQGGNTLSRPSCPFRAQLCPDRGPTRCSHPHLQATLSAAPSPHLKGNLRPKRRWSERNISGQGHR